VLFVRYTALDGRSDSAKAGVDGSILMASRKPQKCVSHKNKTPTTTTTILKYKHTPTPTHSHTHLYITSAERSKLNYAILALNRNTD